MEPQPLPRHHRSAPPRARSAGFGLLETVLIVLLVGTAVAVGFLVLESRRAPREAQAQERALRWADEALVAYAEAHARLPCAVSSPGADAGDCVGAGQKGWLPLRALQAVHPGDTGAAQPLRYMVYRGPGDSDLALASDRFDPHRWDGTAHDFDAVNGLDLCAALAQAARDTALAPKADRARTTDIDGTALNVAYGLSMPGPTAGDAGGRFDGLNQQTGAVMESPARGADSRYDDRVRVRDFNSLARSLGCGYAVAADPDGLVLASLDMLALAVDVSDEVDEQHAGNVEDTELAVGMASAAEFFAVLNVALAAANISNSSSTLATASAQLSAAIASCAVLVGCALIPTYTAAVVAAGVAIGLSATATALAAGALAASTAALAKTVVAFDMAQKPIARGPSDLAGITEQTCLAADGGYRDWDIDEDGNRIDVDPPIFQEGLLQEVQHIEQELVDIQKEIDAADKRLSEIEAGALPFGDGAGLIYIDYGKPVKGEKESDEDYKKRYDKWLEGQDGRVKEWERQLQAKLAAIRKAEDAHIVWDQAVQDEDHRKTELDRIVSATITLQGDVAACDASPPTALDARIRCDNKRHSLAGLLDCDSDYTAVDGDGNRQCLADKQQAYEDAREATVDARAEYARLQDIAVGLAQPPMYDSWWGWGWTCWDPNACNRLIIAWQDDDDDRETYARTYYQRLHMVESLRLKQEELEKKRAAYEKAHAQCETLRNMDPANGSGQPLSIWAGAQGVLEAANCRGATGAVQPVSCAKPAGGSP